MPEDGPHPSHVVRFSWDASFYDEICVNCGATDRVPGGWGKLAEPCLNLIGKGGLTFREWQRQEDERIRRMEDVY